MRETFEGHDTAQWPNRHIPFVANVQIGHHVTNRSVKAGQPCQLKNAKGSLEGIPEGPPRSVVLV